MINKNIRLLALLGAILGLSVLSGCVSNQANKKYESWNVDTSVSLLEPRVSMDNYMRSKSNYWSVLYLFGVYEVDKKFAGFDILYFIDFTRDYKMNYTTYENEKMSWFDGLIPSRSERLKRITLGEMCMNTESTIVMSPMYKMGSNDWLFWQKSDCKTTFYGGKIKGFKTRGQVYKDAFIPNSAEIDKPFLMKSSVQNGDGGFHFSAPITVK